MDQFRKKIIETASSESGFTYFDLVVAMALIVIFSLLVVNNYSDFRQRSTLRSESEKLTSMVRKAQLWALTGQTRGGSRPAGGWGVHVEQCTTPPCSVFLYADTFPVSPPNHTYDAGNDEIVSETYTDGQIQIINVSPLSGTSLDLVFTSPTSTGYINGQQSDNQGLITLYHQYSYEMQQITVDRVTKRVSLGELVPGPTAPACSDGIDNDVPPDGLIDFPDDPGCIDANDTSESNSGSTPPPSLVAVFEDTFTQSNAELTTYTPDIGIGWQQLVSVISGQEAPGTVLRANGVMVADPAENSSGAFYQTTDVISSPNYMVSAKYSNSGYTNGFLAIAARIQDNGNMYYFQWDQNRGQLFLRYSGAWLLLKEIENPGIVPGSQVNLLVYGNRIAVYNDLDLKINVINNDIPDTGSPGRAGVGLGLVASLEADSTNLALDDFTVYENVSAPDPQCNDGLDNDGDNYIDFSDSGCSGVGDTMEYDAVPEVIPVFYDDFNATADTVLDSSSYSTYVGPLIGSGWTQVMGGSVNLRADAGSNSLEANNCGGNQGSLYRIDDPLTSADYEVTVNYKIDDRTDDYSVLAARIQSQYDMYAFHWSNEQGQLWVAQSGTWSQLGSTVGGIPEGNDVTLKVQGSEISVLSNGSEIISVTDTIHSVPGYPGVGSGWVIQAEDGQSGDPDCFGGELDNFKVFVP